MVVWDDASCGSAESWGSIAGPASSPLLAGAETPPVPAEPLILGGEDGPPPATNKSSLSGIGMFAGAFALAESIHSPVDLLLPVAWTSKHN